MRVKRGVAARAKHKKILEAAKGMQHYRTRSYRLAIVILTVIAATANAICAHSGSPASTTLPAKTVSAIAS